MRTRVQDFMPWEQRVNTTLTPLHFLTKFEIRGFERKAVTICSTLNKVS